MLTLEPDIHQASGMQLGHRIINELYAILMAGGSNWRKATAGAEGDAYSAPSAPPPASLAIPSTNTAATHLAHARGAAGAAQMPVKDTAEG